MREDYSGEYNELLSLAATEHPVDFASRASPTLSKQETVTQLFKTIETFCVKNPVDTNLVTECLQFAPRLALTFFRLIYASFFFRVEKLPKNAVVFYSWLVPKSVATNHLVDDYFRNIPNDIENDWPVVVLQQPLRLSLLRRLHTVKRPNNFFVADGLLSFLDIFRLMTTFVFTARVRLKKEYIFKGRNVRDDINRSLLSDYLKMRSFTAYKNKFICDNLLRYSPYAFVYVFENQSWEKICCQILGGHGVKLIGVQGSGFSPLFLNFFPTRLDSEICPMPDTILTVGDSFTRFLRENGFYSIPVKTFAAVRFPYAHDGGHYLVTKPNEKIHYKILYAFSVHLDQYLAILDDLITVFGDSQIEVHLKLHPLFNPNSIKGFRRIPENFEILEHIDMEYLSETYDCVLFNDNSFGIESMINGVKAYQYDRQGLFADERLFYFDLWESHIDLEGLESLRDQILKNSYDKQFNVERLSEYLNSMYRPYLGDSSCLVQSIVSESSALKRSAGH